MKTPLSNASSIRNEGILTFDKEAILRGWTHKPEGHGGEIAPTYCVTDGCKLKP
ncbi:MAG: hypothetical protein OJF47_001511 [Nitrospira sp.]|nr:MAG: hypothetical protein OJF47_001511 [Nitrospira sp.]